MYPGCTARAQVATGGNADVTSGVPGERAHVTGCIFTCCSPTSCTDNKSKAQNQWKQWSLPFLPLSSLKESRQH